MIKRKASVKRSKPSVRGTDEDDEKRLYDHLVMSGKEAWVAAEAVKERRRIFAPPDDAD